MSKISTLISRAALALCFGFISTSLYAHDGHKHKTPDSVYSIFKQATAKIDAAVNKGKVPKSWSIVSTNADKQAKTKIDSNSKSFSATDCSALNQGKGIGCMFMDKHKTLLRFQFTNASVTEKKNLYIFIYADGVYAGANYTGKTKK